MIKLSSLKPGDIVYDCHNERCGNTMMSEMGVWRVKILEVDVEHATVWASWNGNAQRQYWGLQLSWRRWPPEWIPKVFGEPYCAICHRRKSQGHVLGCEHPKAVKARGVGR